MCDLDLLVDVSPLVTEVGFRAAARLFPEAVVGQWALYLTTARKILPHLQSHNHIPVLLRLLADEGLIGKRHLHVSN